MRIDLVLLGLLIAMKSVFAVVELTVFLIQFMFVPTVLDREHSDCGKLALWH